MEPLPKRPRRLSREEKKAQTRERLIAAAQELFARKGFDGTAVDEIAELAGYSRGAFYSNFANKIELMLALIEEGFDSDLEGIRRLEALRGTDTLAAGYQEAGRAFYERPTNLLWMLEFQLSVVRHPELRPAYADQHRKLRDGVKRLVVQHLTRQGHHDPERYGEYADLLLTTLTGLSLMKLVYGDEIDPDLFGRVFKTVIRGIEAEGDGGPDGRT